MKKQLLATAMALTMCASSVSVFAEETTEAPAESAGEVTAESLLEKMQEFSENASSTSVDMTMNLDGGLEISDGTSTSSIGLVMSGDFAMDLLMAPMQMAMNGSMKISVMGTEQNVNMEMYMVEAEDGSTMDTYQLVDDGTTGGEWIRTQVDLAEMLQQFGVSSMEELQNASFESLLPENVTLDWTLEEKEDSYTLSTVIRLADWMDLIEESMKAQSLEITDDAMDMVESLLSGFVMNASYTLDKETCAVTSIHADFNDTDLSGINSFLSEMLGTVLSGEDGSSSTSYALALNDFSIDGTYTYDTVAEITIPADALTAEITDMEDLMEEAEELTEDADDAAEELEDAAEEPEETVEETEEAAA